MLFARIKPERTVQKNQKGFIRLIRKFASTKNEEEVNKFSLVNDWWDQNGTMKGLHAYNKLRIDFVRKNSIKTLQVAEKHHFLEGRRVMDVGSGGGIFVEAVSRFGPDHVTGLDANSMCVQVAENHRNLQMRDGSNFGKNINYVNTLLENWTQNPEFEKYDVTTAFEIIEHVDNPQLFLDQLSESTLPNGLVVLSTMYKNQTSKLLTIDLAENLLNIVDPGTHDWNKYIDLKDLVEMAESSGLDFVGSRNTIYDPISNQFMYTGDWLECNYIAAFQKRS